MFYLVFEYTSKISSSVAQLFLFAPQFHIPKTGLGLFDDLSRHCPYSSNLQKKVLISFVFHCWHRYIASNSTIYLRLNIFCNYVIFKFDNIALSKWPVFIKKYGSILHSII